MYLTDLFPITNNNFLINFTKSYYLIRHNSIYVLVWGVGRWWTSSSQDPRVVDGKTPDIMLIEACNADQLRASGLLCFFLIIVMDDV